MSDEPTRDEIFDRCLTGLLKGDTLDQVLAHHPEHAAALRPALEAAMALRQAPSPRPSGAARQLAMSRMMSQVEAERRRQEPSGVFAWLGSLRARPLAYQAAALAGGLAIFTGLGFGATAATGTTPAPVLTFFRLESSTHTIRINGTVASVNATALAIDSASGRSNVALDASTVVRRGDGRVSWSDLRIGELVEVTANDRGGALTATVVKAASSQGEDGGPATGGAAASPAADDNGVPGSTSGPGHGDMTPESDDHGDEGPGGGGVEDGHEAAPSSTAVTGGHEDEGGGGGDDAPEGSATSTAPTKTPGHDDDEHTPVASATRSTESEHETPEPPEIEPTEDHSSDDGHDD